MNKSSNSMIEKNKKKKRFRKNQIQLWALCLIPMSLVFVFNYLPIGGLVVAFKNFRYDKGIFGSDWVGFENFRYFFESDAFWRVTKNTLVFNSIFIITGELSGIILALLMFEIKSKRVTKFFQTVFILPKFVSVIFVSFMVFVLLNPTGIINNAIKILGGEGISFYTIPEWWLLILPIVQIWMTIGFVSIYYYSSMMAIDTALFEAARIDGANKWQEIRYITLPHLTDLLIILLILDVGSIFGGDFGLFYNVTLNKGALYEWTDTLPTFIYRSTISGASLGMTTAVGFLQSLVGLTLVLVTNGIVRKIDKSKALL